MKFYLLGLLTLLLAWLLPFHRSPWPTFGSEVLTFLSASFLLFAFYKTKIKIARPQLIILPIILIPIVQFLFGTIIYFSNFILSLSYILMFWLMVVAGFSLSLEQNKREEIFQKFCYLMLSVGLISAIIAIFQWLNLSQYFSPWMYAIKGNRPYANLAQPNNLATLLTIGLMACLYFYETKKIRSLYLIPSSLIMLFSITLTQSRTSWVTCIFILVYLIIKQCNKKPRFNQTNLMAWVAIFIVLVVTLPVMNQCISIILSQQLTPTASAVERATSGYLRLDMWKQMLIAVGQQPWFGYGWNQTGMAQIAAFDLHPSHEWYKSAHNIIFDLIIWNGIPLAGLIILYMAVWLYWLNKRVKDTVSIVATLMVCAILIHGMLEYPLHYAYFLLPAGFLLGIIQAQYKNLPSVQMNGKWFAIIGLVTMIGCGVVVRDYQLYKQQSGLASLKTPLTASEQKVMNQEIILLTQFKERVWWIRLDPQTQMNEQDLVHLGKMVANLASKYDLHKYAQVLAFNGYQAEAEHQLWILSELHGQKIRYAELLK